MAKWAALLMSTVVAVLTSAPAADAQHYNTAQVAGCEAVTGGGDAGIRNCYLEELATAERERQQLYGRILNVLRPKDTDNLARAERDWVVYRDAFCSAEHDLFDGGTVGLSATPTCRLSLTRNHVADLRNGFLFLVDKAGG